MRASSLYVIRPEANSAPRSAWAIRGLLLTLSVLCFAPAAVQAQTAASAAKGKDLYEGRGLFAACSECHSADGSGDLQEPYLNAPRLAGQSDWYMARQLKNFKDGLRGVHPQDVGGADMRPRAMLLADDKAIADIAAYSAALKGASYGKPRVKGDVAKGKTLYASCAACHGAKGEGNKALNAPSIKGLQDWYLVKQMKNFKSGVRGSHPKDVYGAIMKSQSVGLSDQAINDLSLYLSSLR